MGKSFMQQFYDGEIYPAEDIMPKDPCYRKLCSEAGEASEKLRKRLKTEDEEIFNEIIGMEERVANIHSFESFSYGFRLGIALMADVFFTDNDVI